MNYTFQFGQVTPYLGYLAAGAWLSLQLAAIAFVAGFLIGLLCASILQYGPKPARMAVRGYVVFFLNTPLLVQIFFLFFALADWGVTLTSFQAVALGMSLNAGAYLTEIQRAGFNSIRAAEIDAAETLGFSRLQSIRYVIVPHICKVLFAPLSNQYIILTMTTSIAAIFGVEELTGRTYKHQCADLPVHRDILDRRALLRRPHHRRQHAALRHRTLPLRVKGKVF